MGSDTLFINGYQRTPYILFAGTVGTVCYLILSSVATIILPLVVILLFGVYFSTATPDVMIDASIADKCKLYPKFASDLQALCFGSFALFSIVGFGTSGIMIQAGGARLTFGILVATALPVFLFGSLGFFGEKRHEGDATHTTQSPSFISEAGASHSNSAPHNMNSSLLPVSNSKSWQLFRVNSDNWRMYKKIFLLAIFMSAAACSLSVVVLATKNWSIRFSAVFFVSIMVCLSVYFSNRKDLPQVANVALFIFLRESCNADLGTAMFYW